MYRMMHMYIQLEDFKQRITESNITMIALLLKYDKQQGKYIDGLFIFRTSLIL